MKELEKQILEWSKSVFPNATQIAVERKLYEEFREARVEVFFRKDRKAAGMELADVVIVATRWLDQYGLSLVDCIAEKLEINRKRVWGPPDETGDRQKITTIPCGCGVDCGSYSIGKWYYCRNCHANVG